jgi:hypothetical protein
LIQINQTQPAPFFVTLSLPHLRTFSPAKPLVDLHQCRRHYRHSSCNGTIVIEGVNLEQPVEAREGVLAMVTTTYAPLPAAEHSAQLRKAVIASTVGTAIEWYDFFLYGTAAGLIFGKLYFPNQDLLAGTLLAFGTYFIGFAARPVGAAIFGHYGDRIGRKATLIATLL